MRRIGKDKQSKGFMYYLVYRITNIIDGKSYTGKHQTHDKNDGYMGSGKYLNCAKKKHGVENFRKEILFEASSTQEMNEKEKELVVLGPMSYNLKEGGQGGGGFSEDVILKISKKLKGKLPWNTGKHLTEQHKSRQSRANKEQIPWNRGKILLPLSEEHKRKLSQSNKGKHFKKDRADKPSLAPR